MRLQFSAQQEQHPQISIWKGIVQPIFKDSKGPYKYQIISEEGVLFLVVPRKLLALFKHHAWEKFIIKGTLIDNKVVRVKTARLEKEETPAIVDFEKKFDLDFYRRAIQRGSAIEPRLEEIS